ncbi:flagellar basal body-associated protein FliL [Aquitalea sp. S1-19]|nr:flagellar basal body-associated protein FliL [Aquitalea sp. S1-19]
MNKSVVIGVVAALVAVLAGGGGMYFWMGTSTHAKAAEPAAPVVKDGRFVSLDKVIVMLKGSEGASQQFMAIDLVFRTSDKQEAEVKAQLPFFRSIAVRSLSQLGAAQASSMSVDAFQQRLAQAYKTTFAGEGRAMPFSEVMVAKLIIE